MSNYLIQTRDATTGRPKTYNSNAITVDFVSVKIGASGLEIKEATGHFDFSGKKLKNIAQGAAEGDVVVLGSDNLIPSTLIPPAALERMAVVADQTARYALTTATVQNGDTVKQTDTGLMYFVIDQTKLDQADGYAVYSAGTAAAVPWGGVSSTPTTLGGYGITDAASSTHDHSGVYEPANANIQSHIGSTSNPHSVTKAQVSLTNVDDVQQMPLSYLDTDGALAANSDTKVPSQKAVVTYVGSQVGSSYVSAFTNGEVDAITIRKVVYIKNSDGKVYLASGSIDLSTTEVGLVAAASIAADASGNITIKDGALVDGFTGMTPGKPQFVDPTTAGSLTETLPTATGKHVVCVGYAITSAILKYKPEYWYLIG